MATTLLTDLRLADGPLPHDDAWVLLCDDRIGAVGAGRAPSADLTLSMGGRRVLPGYLDLHCHGGGGRAVYSGKIEDVRVVARAHRERGTTGMLASIATAELEQMIAAAEAIAAAIDDGTAPNILGIHFEGPFLSPERPGAQTRSALLAPDERVFDRLMTAAGGHAAAMTIAPELDGACDLIRRHRGELVFALGHSNATADQFDAGADAGARHVTHLFNALPPFAHRAPGPIGRALLDSRFTVELIVDGHHLADDTVRLAVAASGADRVVLVTDAMAAAGLGDGCYSFVDRNVDVRDGAAYLRGGTTLAGSTLFIATAVERILATIGADHSRVQRMSSSNAARLMGWHDRGRIAAGARADIVVLDDDGTTGTVFRNGVREEPAPTDRRPEPAPARSGATP